MRKSSQATGYTLDDADALHSCCARCCVHHSCGLWENCLRLKGGDERGGGVREAGKEPSFSPIKTFSWLEHEMQLSYLECALGPWVAEACPWSRACSSLLTDTHIHSLMWCSWLFPRSIISLTLTLLPSPYLALDGTKRFSLGDLLSHLNCKDLFRPLLSSQRLDFLKART